MFAKTSTKQIRRDQRTNNRESKEPIGAARTLQNHSRQTARFKPLRELSSVHHTRLLKMSLNKIIEIHLVINAISVHHTNYLPSPAQKISAPNCECLQD